jgi:hypothetical protein
LEEPGGLGGAKPSGRGGEEPGAAKGENLNIQRSKRRKYRCGEIEGLMTPALMQMLVRAAGDYRDGATRKTERILKRSVKELFRRLGYTPKEARGLTGKILEQMQ